MAQPFDQRTLTLSGDALPVAEQVGQIPYQALVTTAQGLLAYAAASPGMKLTWLERNGKPLGTLGAPADFAAVELSPNEKNVAVSMSELGKTSASIWIFDALRGLSTPLTFGSNDIEPAWSRDGQKIAFISRGRGHRDIYVKSSNGTGTEEPLLADDQEHGQPNWSPDAKSLLYGVAGSGGISVLSMTPPRKSYSFLPPPSTYRLGPFKLSPDGRWVAYSGPSESGGATEIYVVPFPGSGGKRQISNGGGSYPRWRGDGKEIFYVGPDSRLMAAEISIKDNSIQVEQVRPIPIPVFTGCGYMYDVSGDGKRFLVPMPMDQGTIHITLVQNWTQTLNK
jgi:dipeptidyl aminopeptidase/acylaminoacyl peptidase